MASLCIHNFLRECQSEAYTPPAFADWENADHTMIDGAWPQHGMGADQPVEHSRDVIVDNPVYQCESKYNFFRHYCGFVLSVIVLRLSLLM